MKDEKIENGTERENQNQINEDLHSRASGLGHGWSLLALDDILEGRTEQEQGGLGARLVDHFFPDALGPEDKLDDLARGSLAAVSFGSVVCGAFHFRSRVSHGYREPDAAHDEQVGQIIAKIGDLGFLCSGFSQNIFISCNFVPLLLVDKLDVQLFATATQRRAAPAGDDAGAQ